MIRDIFHTIDVTRFIDALLGLLHKAKSEGEVPLILIIAGIVLYVGVLFDVPSNERDFKKSHWYRIVNKKIPGNIPNTREFRVLFGTGFSGC